MSDQHTWASLSLVVTHYIRIIKNVIMFKTIVSKKCALFSIELYLIWSPNVIFLPLSVLHVI